MTKRKLLAELRKAHRHWHIAATHRQAAWDAGKLIDLVADQLSPKERTTLAAGWRKIGKRKARPMFIVPDVLVLTIRTLEKKRR
jgi:hypothetical protein